MKCYKGLVTRKVLSRPAGGSRYYGQFSEKFMFELYEKI